MAKKLELGVTVRETITGFEGVVTGIVYYLTGCNQALVQPKAKDGEFKDSHWFDVQRLEVVADKPTIVLANAGVEGADKAAPRR